MLGQGTPGIGPASAATLVRNHPREPGGWDRPRCARTLAALGNYREPKRLDFVSANRRLGTPIAQNYHYDHPIVPPRSRALWCRLHALRTPRCPRRLSRRKRLSLCLAEQPPRSAEHQLHLGRSGRTSVRCGTWRSAPGGVGLAASGERRGAGGPWRCITRGIPLLRKWVADTGMASFRFRICDRLLGLTLAIAALWSSEPEWAVSHPPSRLSPWAVP